MPKIISDTRTLILRAALQLFLEKGYKDVSYQDLMRKTKLSKGAIYHHFESKDDLLVSVFEFLIESSRGPAIPDPENQVKDYASFRKLFLGTKKDQFKGLKKLMGTRSLNFNKVLFFFEAIAENEKLKKTIMEIWKQEATLLEKCFLGLEKHNKLPKGKDPYMLANSLFWMLQGGEMLLFFLKDNDKEENFIKIYSKTIEDFFKIIKS